MAHRSIEWMSGYLLCSNQRMEHSICISFQLMCSYALLLYKDRTVPWCYSGRWKHHDLVHHDFLATLSHPWQCGSSTWAVENWGRSSGMADDGLLFISDNWNFGVILSAYGICWIVPHDDFGTSSHAGETQQEWQEPPWKVCDGSREMRCRSHPAGMWCHRRVTRVMVCQARELCPSHQVQPAAQEHRPDLDGCGLCAQGLASQWPFHISCTGHHVIVAGFAVAWIECSQLVCCFEAVE